MKMVYIRFDKSEYSVDLLNTYYYCPNCGAKHVMVENDEGDYYNGPQYVCIECKHCFCLPLGCSELEPHNKLSL